MLIDLTEAEIRLIKVMQEIYLMEVHVCDIPPDTRVGQKMTMALYELAAIKGSN